MGILNQNVGRSGTMPSAPPPTYSTFSRSMSALSAPSNFIAGLARLPASDYGWEDWKRRNLSWNAAGRDTWKDVLGDVGMQPGMARSALGFAGDLLFDPLNLVSMPLKGASLGARALRGLGKVGTKIKEAPVTGRLADELGERFVTGYGMPEEYRMVRGALDRDIRGIREKAFTEVRDTLKGTDVPTRTALTIGLEKGSADPALQGNLTQLRKLLDEAFENEFKSGVILEKQKLPNYVPYMNKRGGGWRPRGPVSLGHEVTARNPYAEPRRWKSIEDALKGGAEPDIAKIMDVRLRKGRSAARSADFLKDVAERFGFQGKVTGWKKISESVQGQDVTKDMMTKLGVPLKDIYLPPEIAADVNKLFISLNKEPSKIGSLFDKAQATWRALATIYRPAFHATNYLGNVFNAQVGSDVFLPLAQLRRGSNFAQAAAKHGKEAVEKAMETYGLKQAGTSFVSELGPENLVKQIEMGRTPLWRHPIRHAEAGARKLGSSIEGASKEALFLERLRRGDTIEDAIRSTNKSLFDYGDLTNFERNVMRRIMPFYTFPRKNVPLQLRGLVENPKVAAGYAKFKQDADKLAQEQGTYVPEAYRPGWLSREAGVQVPFLSKPGAPVFVNPYLPLQDLNKLLLPYLGSKAQSVLGETMNAISPFIKTAPELLLNKSFLSGAPLADEQLLKEMGYMAPAKASGITRFLGEMGIPGVAEPIKKKGRDLSWESPLALDYALKNFLPLFESGGKSLTAMREAPELVNNPMAAWNFFSPLRFYSRTPAQHRKDIQDTQTELKSLQRKRTKRERERTAGEQAARLRRIRGYL